MSSINYFITKISNAKVSWNHINLVILGVLSLINIYGYCFSGQSQFYDLTTLKITLGITFLLFLSTFSKYTTTFMLGSVFSLIAFVFIYPRLLFLQFYPDAILMPFTVVLSLVQFNEALEYIFLGLLAILFGAYIFDLSTKRLFKKKENFFRVENNLELIINTVTFILFVTIALAVSLIFGFNIFNGNEAVRQSWMLGLLAVLFTTSTSALVAIFNILRVVEKQSYSRLCLYLIVFIYLIASILTGSRAGPLVILIIIFSCHLVLHGNFRVRIKDLFLFITLLFAASYIAFQVGTQARNALMGEYSPSQITAQASADLEEFIEFEKQRYSVSNAAKSNLNLSLGERKFLSRLFYPFDAAIIGLTLPAEVNLSQKIMTTEYMFKSSINMILPGVIFKDAQLNSSLAWPFIFKLRDEKILRIKYYYETFPWSIWASCYVMYGSGLGLLVMFIVGFVIGILNLGLSATTSEFAFKTCFVYVLASFLFMGGVDDYIVFLITSMNSVLLFILVKKFCILPLARKLYKTFGSQP